MINNFDIGEIRRTNNETSISLIPTNSYLLIASLKGTYWHVVTLSTMPGETIKDGLRGCKSFNLTSDEIALNSVKVGNIASLLITLDK